jgi:hypothetical protein
MGRFRKATLKIPESKTTLAYIAGLMDGEGCLTTQNDSFRLQIAMTDEPVIRWLSEIGGTVSLRKIYGNRKQCWRWLVMAQSEVHQLLSALLPFLRVKKNLARRALEHIEHRALARTILGMRNADKIS